jgi:multidrug resistance efflux pump
MEYDEDALLTARNKLVTLHLAIRGLNETIDGHEDAILSVERVLDEAKRDLDRGLKLNAA